MNKLSFSLAGTLLVSALSLGVAFAQEPQTPTQGTPPNNFQGTPPPDGRSFGTSQNFQGPPSDGRSFGAPQNFQGPSTQGDQRGKPMFQPNDQRQGPPPGQQQQFMGPNNSNNGNGDQFRGGDQRGQMDGPNEGRGGEGDDFEAQNLSRTKQQIKGMERGVSNLSKAIARVKKAGILVPAEYESTVSELLAAIATVKNATETSDAVDSAIAVIEDKGQDMGELGPKIGMLEQFPRIVKEATKQITQARKMLGKSLAKAQKGGVDVTDIKSSIESKLSDLESKISTAKTNPDVEEAMDTLREDVFGGMEDLRDEMSILENISNSTKMLADANKEITRISKAAATLKKQKKDTAELENAVAEMKTILAEVRTLMQSKSTDKNELFDKFSEAEQLHNNALDILAGLRGEKTDIDRQFTAPDASSTGNLGAAVYSAIQAIQDGLGL